MPIGKIGVGKGFRGLLEYLRADLDQNGEPRREVVTLCGTVLADDPKIAAKQFGAVWGQRPNREAPVRHVSVRCAPEDRETFDKNVQADVANRLAELFCWDVWQAISHGDHLHIVASVIRSDGGVGYDSHTKRAIETELRQVRQDYGLRRLRRSPALEETSSRPRQKTRPEQEAEAKGRLTDAPVSLSTSTSMRSGRPGSTFRRTARIAGVSRGIPLPCPATSRRRRAVSTAV
jgi:hypothetical protein